MLHHMGLTSTLYIFVKCHNLHGETVSEVPKISALVAVLGASQPVFLVPRPIPHMLSTVP
jgi:hypothetical protein